MNDLVIPPRSRLGAPPHMKVLVMTFADNVTLTTSGGGTAYEYVELDNVMGGARNFGPSLESITAHTKTSLRSANSRWKVVFWWSVDGITWTGPLDLFAEIGAPGQAIQPAYTMTTNFGLHMRYGIGVRASTGIASESVTVSGVLAFVFKT